MKKKTSILPGLVYLLDPEEMNHVIRILQQHLKEGQPGHGPDMDLIIAPLEGYIQTEYQRIGKRHIGTDAAMEFMLAAEDIKNRMVTRRNLYDEHINLLERKWREWLIIIGWDLWIDKDKYSKGQSEKGSKPRTRNGLDPRARRERNEKILADFEKSPLCLESFAEYHEKKEPYQKGNGEYLKKSAIKKIIQASQTNDT